MHKKKNTLETKGSGDITGNNLKFKNGFRLFARCRCTVAEGSLWNEEEQSLYWIDVTNGVVYFKKFNDKVHDFMQVDFNLGKIGGITFLRDNSLLLFAAQGKVWHWITRDKPQLYAELPQAASSRFNDVITDPEGRIFCGVAPVKRGDSGSLWRMDADKSFSCVEPITAGMPNGMGFSPNLQYFYFTVTDEKIIYRYRYDRLTGALSDKEIFIRVPDDEGFPDGMTVDSDGCIWSAQWNGFRLVRYAVSGEKLVEYHFPIAKISCVSFGGENYSELFVTSANYPWTETDYEQQGAGTVLRLSQNFVGLPEYRRKE